MKLWIISIFDPTTVDKTRPMRFANLTLAADRKGLDTTVFSNTFRHSTKAYRYDRTTKIETHERLRTVFIHSNSYKSNYSLARFYSHFSYLINFRKYINGIGEYPDIIISAMPPIWINYFLSKWCKKQKIPFIMDIIDPWPDAFLEYLPSSLLKIKGLIKPMFLFHDFMLIKSLKNSEAIIAISNDYLQWAAQKRAKSNLNQRVFYPGVDTTNYILCNKTRNQPRSSGLIKVVYAGNLGIAYNIPCILDAISIVNMNSPGKFKFYFAGSGIHLSLIQSAAKISDNIEYLGQLDWDGLLDIYAKCDLGLAQYQSNATQTITYKLFDYAAAGLVILNSLQTEMAELIDKYKAGVNNLPGNYMQLAENILYFKDLGKLLEFQKNALFMASEIGDNKLIYDDYIKYALNLRNV